MSDWRYWADFVYRNPITGAFAEWGAEGATSAGAGQIGSMLADPFGVRREQEERAQIEGATTPDPGSTARLYRHDQPPPEVQTQPDGSFLLPDRSRLYQDGTLVRPDGYTLVFTGHVRAPDGRWFDPRGQQVSGSAGSEFELQRFRPDGWVFLASGHARAPDGRWFERDGRPIQGPPFGGQQEELVMSETGALVQTTPSGGLSDHFAIVHTQQSAATGSVMARKVILSMWASLGVMVLLGVGMTAVGVVITYRKKIFKSKRKKKR